ncbi:MAG: CPBP family intramembrane metalloprotease [Alteromonadaceae bacterium]|nr:CPBP family intramembrane metalloprotease [Alteromonadaceae bacterium]
MTGSEHRVNGFVKALLFWAIFQGLFFTGGFSFLFPMLPKWGSGILLGSVITGITFLVTLIFLKFDTLTLSDLGMVLKRSSLSRFGVALLFGCGLFAGFYSLYYLLTPVSLSPVESANILHLLLINTVLFIVLGTMEEVAFRGYLLEKMAVAVGIRWSIYITSLLFGLYHGLAFESITGPAVWGLFYGVLAFWTRGLAVPIGFHVGVNLVQGLMSEKTKWVEGIWRFELMETVTPLTIAQLTLLLQGLMLISGILLVEYYLRVSIKRRDNSLLQNQV